MGRALTEAGRDWGPVDALIGECTAAGVVFRPKEGQLRPLLTAGRPPDGLLARVKASVPDIRSGDEGAEAGRRCVHFFGFPEGGRECMPAACMTATVYIHA